MADDDVVLPAKDGLPDLEQLYQILDILGTNRPGPHDGEDQAAVERRRSVCGLIAAAILLARTVNHLRFIEKLDRMNELHVKASTIKVVAGGDAALVASLAMLLMEWTGDVVAANCSASTDFGAFMQLCCAPAAIAIADWANGGGTGLDPERRASMAGFLAGIARAMDKLPDVTRIELN